MSDYAAEERAGLIAHIRKVPAFLDAVFLIHYHKRRALYWGGLPEITADEVFEAYDATDYADCLDRSMALLEMSPQIGEAALRYPGAISYEQALKHLKLEHPGFSEECYDKVRASGMFEMR